MDNCTIYSHHLDFEKIVHIVKSALPKASIDYIDNGKQKSLVATIKGGFFGQKKTLKINYRERAQPSYKLEEISCGLTQNLAGMVNFIQSLPSQNESVKGKFLHKVMAANCEMSFMTEPELNIEFQGILSQITNELDAFIFAQPNRVFNKSNGQHFLDKHFNLILDTSGICEIQDIDVNVDTKYHDQSATTYNEEQLSRKTKSEEYLEFHGIKVNKNLPCSASLEDVILRTTSEVIDRAYALMIMGVKGEGIEQEHLVKAVAGKNIDSFSPQEAYIYQAENLTDQERAYATWRYESLYTLLWALGVSDDLKHPNEICDVSGIVGSIFQPSRADFETAANMRSAAEILDELDKTYRMNWACVDARIKGEKVEGGINPSVIYERHYALNWITQYQGQDWDDVQTNT